MTPMQAAQYSQDGDLLILLDALPDDEAVQRCIEQVLQLHPGESADIYASDDAELKQVCRWMHGFDSLAYGLCHTQESATRSKLRITHRGRA